MAMYEVTGGGSTKKVTPSPLSPAFSIAGYRAKMDEARRKRAEAARIAAEKAHAQAVQQQLKAKVAQALPTADKNAPTSAFRARADQMARGESGPLSPGRPVLSGVQDAGIQHDPIFQYRKLVQSWGQDRVAKRMEAISTYWNSVNGGYNGSDVVWELTRSQYTLDEIKNMIDESHYILFDPQNKDLGTRAMNIEEKRVLLKNKYNMRSREWAAMEQVFQAQEDGEIPTGWEEDPVMTILIMSSFIPNPFSFAGTAAKVAARGATVVAEAAGREAANLAAETVLQVAAKKMTQEAANLVIGQTAEAAVRAAASVAKVTEAAAALRVSQVATSYASTVGLRTALNSARLYKHLFRLTKMFGVGAAGISAGLEELAYIGQGIVQDKSLRAEQGLQFAASPMSVAFDSPFEGQIAEHQPTPLEEIRGMRQFMLAVNARPEAGEFILGIKDMWRGVGLEMEEGPIFTPRDQAEVIKAMEWTVREAYDQQRLALADNDAPYYAPINGDLFWTREGAAEQRRASESAVGLSPVSDTGVEGNTEVEGWPQWLHNREMRLQLAEEAAEQDPEKAKFFEQAGWPTNEYESKRFWNGIRSNGWMQALYATPLKLAEMAGRTAEATLAGANLWVREQKDPLYQARRKALFDYVAEQDFQENEWFKQKPERDQMSESFCKTQIAVGYLKDDPRAVQLWNDLQQSARQLIDERYAADPFLTVAYGLTGAKQYQGIRRVALEHPEAVEATNMAFWILAGAANPIGRTRRMIFKPTVRSNMAAWNTSARAYGQVSKVVDYLMDKDMGAAARIMQGAGASTVLNSFWRWRGKKSQSLDWKSEGVMQLARQAVNEVQAGNPQVVAQILEGAPNIVVDTVVTKATLPLTPQQIAGWVGYQNLHGVLTKQYARTVEGVAKYIAQRQSRNGDAVSRNVLLDMADQYMGEAYVTGRQGSVFPYLRDSRLSVPKRSVEWLQESIAGVRNDWVRELLTRTVMPLFTRGPLANIDYNAVNTVERVYDAALAVSQDAAWAANFRSRWVSAQSPHAYQRLISELDTKFSQKYRGRTTDDAKWYQKIFNPESEFGGQALAPNPWGNTPGTLAYKTADVVWHDATGAEHRFNTGAEPELLTQYLSYDAKGNKVYRQALPDKVYALYSQRIHRAALWAPYNTKYAWNTARGMAEANRWRNIASRYPVAIMHHLSTPLRQWTVAMGAPLLFQKHAITDTSRTLIEEGPFSILEAFGLRPLSVRGKTIVPQVRSIWQRKMARIFDETSVDAMNYVEYRKTVIHNSEAQWHSGNRASHYRANTIWGNDGRLRDLDGSADALMRITRGTVFQEWARGGEDAVRAWLETPAGKQFLGEGDWARYYKSVVSDMEEGGRKFAPKEVEATLTEEFIQTIVREEWARLETALPNIMPVLKQRAIGGQIINKYELQELIKNNPTDNAVLSMPVDKWGVSGLAGHIVGKAMAPNKWNRDVMFDSVFTRTYSRLRKDGMAPDDAARVAADVAELNVSRVHFDLANATATEARHRWLAWFATKHRLYGTYMAKLALERPQLAAVIPTIERWMEERNEDKNVSEYDKWDLVFDIGGAQFSINLAPYMWFSEFPLESSAALAIERTAEYLGESVAGLNIPGYLKPSPAPFGITFTRGDALLYTIHDLITGRDVQNDQELQSWLDSLPQDRRLQWRRLIANQKAVAEYKGEPITDMVAFGRAKAAAFWTESWQTFKVYSGKVYGAPVWLGGKPREELELQRLQREFTNETDEDKAKQMLQDYPALAISINASMDPVEKTQMDIGWRAFDLAYGRYEASMQEASDQGPLVLLSRYEGITKNFYDAIDQIKTDNPTFAKYWGDSNEQGLLDAFGLLLPLVPRDKVWEAGRPKTTKEIEDKKAELKLDLVQALEPIGLAVRDQEGNLKVMEGAENLMLYQLLQDAYVNVPLSEFTGENPYSLAPYRANSVGRWLARKTENGVHRRDEFMDLVKDQTFRQWMGTGLGSNGKASSARPMMGYLDALKKEALGWNADPRVVDIWLSYAKVDADLHQWLWTAENPDGSGKAISASSNVYKETYKATMEQWYKKAKATTDPEVFESWENEYEFSKLRLDQRLAWFGVGKGESEEQKVTGEFLAIVGDMWDELGRTPNPNGTTSVTPGAQTGGPIVREYLRKVGDLALAHPAWWDMMKNTYPLSKFGFVTQYKLDPEKDAKYMFLYAKEDDNIADEPEEIWLQGLGE